MGDFLRSFFGDGRGPAIALGLVVACAAWFFRYASKNRLWDRIFGNMRDTLRHGVAVLLLVGTTSATLWTFSAGKLVLVGGSEVLISTAGVALAVEVGAVLLGLHLQELDRRLLKARGRDAKILRSEVSSVKRWFLAIVGISAVSGSVFRIQQLNNVWLGVFVGVIPAVLVYVFTVVLRPLPIDYQEKGKAASERALTIIVENANTTMMRLMRQRTLSEEDKRLLAVSQAQLGIFAGGVELERLNAATAYLGIEPPQAAIVDADDWVDVETLRWMYGWAERTAQNKIKTVPGYRLRGKAYEAPKAAILRKFGPETPVLMLENDRKPRRTRENSASVTQEIAAETQTALEIAS